MSGELVPERREMRASHDDRDEVVERLRVAAGDGRLTAQELDERLEVALTARTYGELERLVADLPAVSGGLSFTAPGAGPDEVVRLHTRSGSILRDGRWPVPAHIDVDVRSGNVRLDLTAAVFHHPTLGIQIAVGSGNLVLVVPPAGIHVDVDGITVRSGSVKVRSHPDPAAPIDLRVTISGTVRSGNVVVRGPRRGLWETLFDRPGPAPKTL